MTCLFKIPKYGDGWESSAQPDLFMLPLFEWHCFELSRDCMWSEECCCHNGAHTPKELCHWQWTTTFWCSVSRKKLALRPFHDVCAPRITSIDRFYMLRATSSASSASPRAARSWTDAPYKTGKMSFHNSNTWVSWKSFERSSCAKSSFVSWAASFRCAIN